MEVWSSSGTEESERESSISQDEEDEEEQEESINGLCRELVKGNGRPIWGNDDMDGEKGRTKRGEMKRTVE